MTKPGTQDTQQSGRAPVGQGYTVRWRQEGYDGEITGRVVYDSLKDIVEKCTRINTRWAGEIEQWPVEWNVDKAGKRIGEEAGDLRRLVGIKGAQKGRDHGRRGVEGQ